MVVIWYSCINYKGGNIMTDQKVADFFNMPVRTYARFKKAEPGTWRKKIYYLMMEEMLRVDKLKG